MGDTTNWEFAAAVAAVTMGLGGLLLFTLIGTIGSWRVFERARRASIEAEKASVMVQDLARQVSAREAAQGSTNELAQTSAHLETLRRHADALIEQQTRLQDAVRNLVEAGVLRSEESQPDMKDVQSAVRRLEDQLSQIAAAVANLGARQI